MDKTRKSTSSKIWPYSTCAISVWKTGQILLVVDFLVLSTTSEAITERGYIFALKITNIRFSVFLFQKGHISGTRLTRTEYICWVFPVIM